ncbi:MAG: tetratricopeptide repeat protein [Deltaproteobacteria bacterium]|nr:tetratricopeptide repeat protein [Deltaproteobacteria bacterium]
MALKDKLMERAQAHLAKGALDKAILEYKAAFDSDPKDISIRLRVGDLYVKMGKKTEAIEEYKEVAKANSQRGFYLKAIAVYKQVLKLEETNYEIHYKLAELYAKQRLISDAIGEYSLLVSSFEKKGKTGEVMQLLKEMLDIDPDNIGIRLKLAELYQKLNFENDALGEYAVIFKKYMAQDKLDKAEKTFTTLYKTYPKDIRILKGLSELYKKRHDDEKFLKFTKAAFNVYVERRDAENARAVCDAILEVSPKDEDCLKYLGKGPEPAKDKAGAVAKGPARQPLDAAPLISFPELSEPPVPEQGMPLISFPEVGEPSKTPEPPALLRPEEEPMISFPETGLSVDLGGDKSKEEAPHEPLFEVEVEEGPGTVEEGGGRALELDISGVKATEVEFEMPGAAAQREVDAILSAVAADVSAGASAKGAPEAVTPSAPEEEAAEEIVFEVAPEAAHEEEVAEEIVFEVAPEAAHEEEVAEEIVFETEPEIADVPEAAPEEAIEAAPVEETSLEIEEEIITEHVETDEAAAPAQAGFTHDDLTKSISEMTEHHEPLEMVEELPDEVVETRAVPEAASVAEAGQTGSGDEFVDLSKELGMEDALSDLAGSWGAGSSKEAFDEFKTGIGNQLNKEDSETHFNLGIAYMEMELLGEAVKEFKIALKDPLLEFDCYTRLALCSMSEGKYEDAIGYYTKGLRVTGRSDEERKGMMYELALAYEADEKFEEAGKLYAAVSAVDPDYRETAKKVRMISETVHTIPMADGMLEVELI